MRNCFRYLTVCLLLISAMACSKFERLRKTTDIDKKYQAAVAYYEKKDYLKADILFEDIIPLLKGSKESEMAQFYRAYCKYYTGDYILGEYYFKNFYETFSRSELAEEAMFMRAMSLYEQSPTFNLDQTNSLTAISALQSFINAYPESKHREKCGQLLQELRVKLERKAYEQATLYARIGDHKAAVIALNNFERGFPDSEYNEEIAFLKVENAYNLAKQSILAKRTDRFREAVSYYQNFIDKYPSSKFLRTAEKYYENSLEELGGSKNSGSLQSSASQ